MPFNLVFFSFSEMEINNEIILNGGSILTDDNHETCIDVTNDYCQAYSQVGTESLS